MIDGIQSVVFDQAENRLHAQKALLLALLTDLKGFRTVKRTTKPTASHPRLLSRRVLSRSQEELAHLLEQQGYEATQALFRAISRSSGLMKVPLRNGNGAAIQVRGALGRSDRTPAAYIVLSAELVERVRGSGNLIVLRHQPGSAMMLASAIDGAEWPEILGTIARRRHRFVAIENPEKLSMLVQRFLDMKG